jgi:hypothetical protein
MGYASKFEDDNERPDAQSEPTFHFREEYAEIKLEPVYAKGASELKPAPPLRFPLAKGAVISWRCQRTKVLLSRYVVPL